MHISSAPTVPDAAHARRDVWLFLTLVTIAVAGLSAVLISAGRPIDDQPLLVVLLMATPALVSVVLRLARREGFGDVSFRPGPRGSWRWYLLVWLVPIAVGSLAYGIGWATGLAPLRDDVGGLQLVMKILVNATLGVPLSAVLAAGEEIGWRGYLLPRLVQAGAWRPVLSTSIVWWLFHVPLILAGLYVAGPSAPLSALIFAGAVLALGALAGWSRLATGSVWPAVLLHATWNAVIQGGFDAVTSGGTLWIGESGLLVAAASVLLAIGVWRWRKK